jgi:hypothetical protein
LPTVAVVRKKDSNVEKDGSMQAITTLPMRWQRLSHEILFLPDSEN